MTSLSKQGYSIKKDCFDEKDIENVKKELTVEVKNGMFDNIAPKKYVLYQENDKKLYIPKYYGLQRFGVPDRNVIGDGEHRPNMNFIGTLRENQVLQVNAFLEACKDPNKMGAIVNVPCGFGKTTSLLSVINSQPDLKFLVVVNTLDEVDRIMLGVSQGRMFAPKDALEANANKGDQLEKLLVAKKSVVITHKLYEKAGRLADGGLLQDYSVIIDEVPNTISALPPVKPESMKEIYLDKGFLEMSPTAELRVTQKWIDEYDKFSDT